jgi:hypothetical protein
MKKHLRIILLGVALVFLMSGCIHCKPCPPDDVITYTWTPFGPITIEIPKGFFTDEENKGEWMLKKDWDKLMEEPEAERMPGERVHK